MLDSRKANGFLVHLPSGPLPLMAILFVISTPNDMFLVMLSCVRCSQFEFHVCCLFRWRDDIANFLNFRMTNDSPQSTDLIKKAYIMSQLPFLIIKE